MITAPAPTQAAEILDRVRLERAAMPDRLRRIADAMIESPDAMAHASVAELGERLGLAPSALVRFAQHLGFTGFSPLQHVLRRDVAAGDGGYLARMSALRPPAGARRSDLEHVLEAYLSANVRALEAARAALDLGAMQGVVDTLRAAGLVAVMGQHRAFPLAAYLFYGLARLERRTVLIDSIAGMAGAQVGLLGPRDAFVAVSFAPYAEAVLEAGREAQARGATVLAVTDAEGGPWAELARHAVVVADTELGGIRSIAVTSTVVQTLFVALGLAIDPKRHAAPAARTREGREGPRTPGGGTT